MSKVEVAAIFTPNDEGLSQTDVVKRYDDWGSSYEQDVYTEGYIAPSETAKLVADYYQDKARGGVTIIDIGAGTGLAGIELKKHGFTHIDGLEPSVGMIQHAQQREIYENYYVEYMSTENPCTIDTGKYDCAISIGCFGGTHIPATVLEEVVRIVKPGGLIVVAVRRDLEETDNGLATVSKALQKKGKLTTLDTVYTPQFRKGHRGVMFVYRTL